LGSNDSHGEHSEDEGEELECVGHGVVDWSMEQRIGVGRRMGGGQATV
jgi:hypothetical protein